MEKYFINKGNSFFVFEKNWENYRKEKLTNAELINMKQEPNQDIQVKIRTNEHLGDIKKTKLLFKELNKIRKLLKNKYPKAQFAKGGYGDEFEIFSTSVIFNLPYDYVIKNNHTYGSDDGKVDSFYVDSESKILYLCQIKIGDLDDQELKEKMEATHHELVIDNNRVNKSFYKTITKNYQINDIKTYTVNYLLVSRKKVSGFTHYKVKDIVELFIEKSLLPVETSGIRLVIKKTTKDDLLVEAKDKNMGFFFCDSDKFVKAVKDVLGDNFEPLFYENVRGRLSPNKELANTIINEPENFQLYNNGISIVCNNFRENNSYITIEQPSIVNGQQTLYSLLSSENSLTNVSIPIFLKKKKSLKTTRNIAKYNNTQTKISDLDLASLSQNIKILQEKVYKFSNEKKYFLDIYSSGKIRARDNVLSQIDLEKIALKDFLRLYFTIKFPTSIGKWKNSFTLSLRKSNYETEDFEIKKVMPIIITITEFNKYLMSLKNDKEISSKTRLYDLHLMYIMYKYENNISKSIKVIDEVIENNKDTPIPDLFRGNNIWKEIKKVDNKL